ncbi:hypothetical protein [Pelagerythrobacter sp.]|uniref:hypothetical protein n=1 Tax=Pelagerythrobacter sp. TaxID=2800702 RepID=UPI0035AED882
MEPNLFRSRGIALAFAGLVLVGVVLLVGSERDAGLLDRFVRNEPDFVEEVGPIEESPGLPSRELYVPPPETSAEMSGMSEGGGEFASDEELIDDTAGLDSGPTISPDSADSDGALLEDEGEAMFIEPGGELDF